MAASQADQSPEGIRRSAPKETAARFRHPEFLTDHDVPIYRIRCPVHGFIHFSANEREIIDHPLFRRLRFIRQLALTELVYPGATHTRFEHSLGVMEIATSAFDHLASRRGDLLEQTFMQVAGLEQKPLAKARQVLRIAALLHDVGHACFSHAAETIIHKDAGHEGLTTLVIEQKDLLGSLLESTFFSECAAFVSKVLQGGGHIPPQLQILRDLVSGEMDADRTDYLVRDSLHCGVEYGRFDYERMIECLDLNEGPGGTLEIALQRDGLHTFEALILARYQMNTQVYYHRLRRVYDYYLCRYFEARGTEDMNSPEKILTHNDVTMTAMILRDADRSGEECGKWARRIRDRHHHRVVHETGEEANAMALRYSAELFRVMKDRYPQQDFIWDKAGASIHKLLLPDDSDDDGRVILPLVERGGKKGYVGESSHILRRIPRTFQVARIFCDLGRDQESLQAEIVDHAHNEYRRLGGR